ncbi:MAG: ABC transporter ATP-binding protein [Ignavibacteria bacterium]|jgi:heme exporter protein A|nr:ABC transporter ATP-binding protein [Ignavibacteria bacterium]
MNRISLKCENLEKSFLNKVVFRDVSFELLNGSSIAVTGRNGSGKSTLLKVIANLLIPNKGKVILTNNDGKVVPEKFHFHVGMIAPYINLYDELTALENLEFFFDLKCGKGGSISRKEYLKELLNRVNLYQRRNDQVKNFSSGMKQRLKLAFAIINDPPVLIMDEPRTNLDTEGISLVYSTAEKKKKDGILIIATNEPEDTKLCDTKISIEDYK